MIDSAPGRAAADGEAPPVQLLTPDGQRVDHPDYHVDLSAEQLRGMYRDMALVRKVDAEATALQRQGELGLWVPCLGQEAAQVGSGRAARPTDQVFPTYREHGVAWCRGLDLLQVLAFYRGVTLGGWDPAQHGFHLYTIVIGDQVLHATGYAMGIQRDGAVGTGDPERDTAVLAYFGDGASSQGDVHEAMVFASVFNAPVVFLCQNNGWAISVPSERQARVPIHRRAHGFGIPGVRVDGNDVLAVYAVTAAALARARGGDGPMLIEAETYRMGAHTTSDDPTRYRESAEVEAWRERDPLTRLRAHLTQTDQADEAFFADVDAEAAELAARVRLECLALPNPPTQRLFEHVYREPHPLIAEERSWLADYEASFVDPANPPASPASPAEEASQ